MLHDKMDAALNEQVKWELWSSYLYLSMSSYFQDMGLAGFANWMKVQEQEEKFHADKFYNYTIERGGRIRLQTLEAPPSDWKTPLAAFEDTLKHEQGVTARINGLMDLAIELKDHATVSYLKWFIDEQVEEEASVQDILNKLKLVEGNPSALYMLDKELATRVFTPPVA
ncbi:Bacterial non-heme ferritin [Fundidesulfovibrio magnetotacticus]|uniref:Ferritin n=1 Tax=Fundidesulfovibrio magnetotacticus TaxID=2730080 RepID=A0A6V8LTP3_9BACT|nr:ferritin [Fundidesulfovibrio magnetotacticus]GFK95832.1 Bacterial non-heme ferritin [Fundidesulfovibrio magnetotacticus]